MSLSRRRQDKASGTGRFHIMKNRYGMDGITYAAIIDTSTGRIDINTNELSEEDMENERPKKLNENFDTFDRDILKKKFFELNNTSNS
jgi:hypothetical protein